MEKDQSRFIILRFDNYINAANTKGNFLLAFNTFLCGGIISNYKYLLEFVDCPSNYYLVNYCIIALFIFSIITTFFIINAVYPFLKSGNSSIDKYHSHIFFNSVAEFKNGNKYYTSLNKQTAQEVDEDLANQSYHLAKGLKKKFRLLKYAMWFVYGELTILTILLIILSIY